MAHLVLFKVRRMRMEVLAAVRSLSKREEDGNRWERPR